MYLQHKSRVSGKYRLFCLNLLLFYLFVEWKTNMKICGKNRLSQAKVENNLITFFNFIPMLSLSLISSHLHNTDQEIALMKRNVLKLIIFVLMFLGGNVANGMDVYRTHEK